MKKIILTAILIGHLSSVIGQTLSPKASPTSGGYYNAGGNSLSWTMGETYNTTLTTGATMLTQGQQQPTIVTCVAPVGSASNVTICNGDPANVALNSTIAGTTFAWTSAVISGGVIGQTSCSTGCGTSIPDYLTNIGFIHGVVQYTVIPTSGTCPGPAFTVNVTVGTAPAAPVITGPAVACGLNSATYSIASIADATGYVWTIPSTTGMTMVSGQGTTAIAVTISSGATLGNVTCMASNGCGNSAITSLTVTKKPGVPDPIVGPTSVCGQSAATYSIPPTFGATSYQWIPPTNMTITTGQGTTQITTTINGAFVSGPLKVNAINSCGYVPGATLIVTGNVPSIPGAISGPLNVCGVTNTNYSIAPVAGATGYLWTITGGGTINGSNTGTSVNVSLSGTAGGTISCSANNLCGTGTARTITLTVAATQPGTITGPSNICGSTSATYSVAAVTGTTTYNWSLSAVTGWTIASGQGTTSVVIHGPATGTSISGLVKVTSTNACGNISGVRTMAVTSCHNGIGMNKGSSEKASNISIYPNPTTGEITIDNGQWTMDNGQFTVEICNVIGERVFQSAINNQQSTINIYDLSNGMYFVRLIDTENNILYSERVVKQ